MIYNNNKHIEIDTPESVIKHQCVGNPCLICLIQQTSDEDFIKLLVTLGK